MTGPHDEEDENTSMEMLLLDVNDKRDTSYRMPLLDNAMIPVSSFKTVNSIDDFLVHRNIRVNVQVYFEAQLLHS